MNKVLRSIALVCAVISALCIALHVSQAQDSTRRTFTFRTYEKVGDYTLHSSSSSTAVGFFAHVQWSRLSFSTLDDPKMLDPEVVFYDDQRKRSLFDYALEELEEDKILLISLRSTPGNNSDVAARIAARLMNCDGWVMSYRSADDKKVYSYHLKNSVLTKSTSDSTKETVVERDLKRFSGKLAILVDKDTSGSAVAIVHALKRTRSALLVGESTKGDDRFLDVNGNHLVEASVDVETDVSTRSYEVEDFAVTELVKHDLYWVQRIDFWTYTIYCFASCWVLALLASLVVLFADNRSWLPAKSWTLSLCEKSLTFLAFNAFLCICAGIALGLAFAFWPTIVVCSFLLGQKLGFKNKQKTTKPNESV